MTRINVKSLGFCAILCAALVSMPRLDAQSTTGSITGQVTDQTDAVIPNVAIKATEVNKGISFTGKTNGAGEYQVLNVTPGTYTVTASIPGFATAEAHNATIAIDQKLLLNFKL